VEGAEGRGIGNVASANDDEEDEGSDDDDDDETMAGL
jgi:hypothetical protein